VYRARDFRGDTVVHNFVPKCMVPSCNRNLAEGASSQVLVE